MDTERSDLNVSPTGYYPVDVYEVKILLAYFLARINRPVTPAQLLQIATGDGIVDYFLYTESVSQMLDGGIISLTEQEGTEYYILTEQGRKGAESFKNIVIKSVRDRIYSAGLKLFARLKAEQDARFEITPGGAGYQVRCVCKDGDITLMDMTLFAPDKEQAEHIKARILMNPSEFYAKVIDYVVDNREYVPDISE